MSRAWIVLAVAVAAASSVWAQTKDTPRRPVPFERKPVERVEATDQGQAQAPERTPAKNQPAARADARPM